MAEVSVHYWIGACSDFVDRRVLPEWGGEWAGRDAVIVGVNEGEVLSSLATCVGAVVDVTGGVQVANVVCGAGGNTHLETCSDVGVRVNVLAACAGRSAHRASLERRLDVT